VLNAYAAFIVNTHTGVRSKTFGKKQET